MYTFLSHTALNTSNVFFSSEAESHWEDYLCGRVFAIADGDQKERNRDLNPAKHTVALPHAPAGEILLLAKRHSEA